MKLVENFTIENIETGDIVGWNGHIGIAYTSPAGTPRVISSTGTSSTGGADCVANIKPPRGPRSLTVLGLGLGNPTFVLRLQPKDCVEGQIIQVNGVDRYKVVGSDCSIVADLVTGLEWQRCSVGQTWNMDAQSCDGEVRGFSWDQALTLTAPGGFRLPTITESRSLLYCSNTGVIGVYVDNVLCGNFGTFQIPTIIQDAFPNTTNNNNTGSWSWWSSTLDQPYPGHSWMTGFYWGNVNHNPYNNDYTYNNVRLVRSGP